MTQELNQSELIRTIESLKQAMDRLRERLEDDVADVSGLDSGEDESETNDLLREIRDLLKDGASTGSTPTDPLGGFPLPAPENPQIVPLG